MYSLIGISGDVAQFLTGCNHLLAALSQQTTFSETEKVLISRYCQELMTKTETLRDGDRAAIE